MSWFEYGTPNPKKRHLRKGVWLRVAHLPKPLLKEAKKKLQFSVEFIDWVVVSEMRPDNEVLLEFWCHNPRTDVFKDGTVRYTVFHILTKEDPTWVCEGDLGRGYKDVA